MKSPTKKRITPVGAAASGWVGLALILAGWLPPGWAQESPQVFPVPADRISTIQLRDLVLAGSAFAPAPAGLSTPGTELLSVQAAGFTPFLRANFLGVLDNHTATPPDTQGAVGPEHVMLALNTEVVIQTRQGQTLLQIPLANFWQGLGASVTYAPKVVYDQLANRWVMVTLAEPNSVNSKVLVGVSTSADPTGGWLRFPLDADPEKLTSFDHPSLGFNQNWLVLSLNNLSLPSSTFQYASIITIDKIQLYAGTGLAVLRFKDTQFTVVPAVCFEANAPALYLVSEAVTNLAGTNSQLRLSKIQADGLGHVLYYTNLALTSPVSEWLFSPGPNNFVPQLGSPQKLFANDSRLLSCVQRQGHLWLVQHVFLPAAGNSPTHCAVQWWQIGTNGTIVQRGRIEDPTGVTNYFFPSLAVNRNNDVLLGYTRGSANQYVSGNYAFRLAEDPLNSLRADTVLKAGLASYSRPKINGQNRWGNYSATVVDPLNDVDMWTLQPYAELPDGTGDRSGVWWGYLGFQALSPPVIIASPTNQPVWAIGGTVTVTAEVAGTEPRTYQWRFNGASIPSATSATLTINNFQPGNAGYYSVVVSNAAGYAISGPGLLGFVPLTVTEHPATQNVRPSGSVTLRVAAMGTQPIYFQWQRNGTNLPNATDATLTITNFQTASAGDYRAVLSNIVGAVTSATATLTARNPMNPQQEGEQMTINPQTHDPEFSWLIGADPQANLTVQVSSDLKIWTDYFSFTNPAPEGSAVRISDPNSKYYTIRFYRIRVNP